MNSGPIRIARDALLLTLLPGIILAWLALRHGRGWPAAAVGCFGMLPLLVLPTVARAVKQPRGSRQLFRDLGGHTGDLWRLYLMPVYGPTIGAGLIGAGLLLLLIWFCGPLGNPLAGLHPHRSAPL